MTRSICKGKLRIYSRSGMITKGYLMKEVEVHIGNKFVEFTVTKKMLGGRFGDYAITKRMGSFIHKKKKKKGKGKMRRKKGG